jgi:two-component system nitrate/nitrite response regulator NarL
MMNDLIRDEADRVPQVKVVVVLRNQLERYGVERMLHSVEIIGACWSDGELAAGIDTAAEDESAVLIVALRDIDEAAGSALRRAAEDGVQILVLAGPT